MAELTQYVRAWRERAAREERQIAHQAARARAVLPRLAQHLVTRYGARRVLLVGSLRRGTFGPGSDIDLAVEGLQPRDIEQAMVELEGMEGFSVDVLPLEQLSPRWRAHLERWSEPLWPPA